jgi:hypothetical protein
VLDWQGKPVFAELAILRAFEEQGWQGVWVDSFGRLEFRTELPERSAPIELPESAEWLYARIAAASGGSRGCWDVFAWCGSEVAFAESKLRGKDKIHDGQLRWLAAALDVGVPMDAFSLVEWRVRR